ncbi:MAG: divalent-cation tolerance protein CutA [Nanoarchaeota archaeon]
MIVIGITFKDKKEAKKIISVLIESKLIACANIFPIESMFYWNNKVELKKEIFAILKTKKTNYNEIKKIVKKLHSYSVPLIESWNIDNINKDYKKWLNEVLK